MSGLLSQIFGGGQPQVPGQPTQPGILSKLLGGVNQFSENLLEPKNGLGKLGMYLGAASGAPLGAAGLQFQKDQLDQGDTSLARAYKVAQIRHLTDPTAINNDTVNDYNFIQSTLGKDKADEYLKNFAAGPPVTMDVQQYPGGPVVRQVMPRSQYSSPASSGPKAGEIVDGFRFKGGNPNDRNSWETAGGADANPQPFR